MAGEVEIRVVRQVADRILVTLRPVSNRQTLLRQFIGNPNRQIPRVTLLPIRAEQGEDQPVIRSILHRPNPFVETHQAAVEMIDAVVVGGQ